MHCQRGIWRLQGSLAVSRGIGDMFYKQWVTPEPDTSTIKIDSESEFLILASDGLWDKVCFTIRYITCLLRSFSGKIIRLHGKI